MKIGLSQIFWRELKFRVGTFLLGVLAIAVVSGSLIGAKAFLVAHDAETADLTEALEERSTERMEELRNEARKFSKNLGFNCMLLPPGQNLGELYALGKSTSFFTEVAVDQLAAKRPETVNHLRPILRERVIWPENERSIILVGVKGQVYIKAPRWQKPIEEAIAPGKAHIGRVLADELDLGVGDNLVFMGRSFEIEHLLPQTGTEDDLALRIDLGIAQGLLGHEDEVSAVLCLMCDCADGDPEIVRRELDQFIPGIQVVDFTTRAEARQRARTSIREGTAAQIEDMQQSRIVLRAQIERFSGLLIGLVSIGTVLLLCILTFNNAREREGEVSMLRALGVNTIQIVRLFLAKALLTGILGGALGALIGVVGLPLFLKSGLGIESGFLGIAIIVSIGISVLGSLIPALISASKDPAGVLNRE